MIFSKKEKGPFFQKELVNIKREEEKTIIMKERIR